jgi:hypothetical protein
MIKNLERYGIKPVFQGIDWDGYFLKFSNKHLQLSFPVTQIEDSAIIQRILNPTKSKSDIESAAYDSFRNKIIAKFKKETSLIKFEKFYENN